MKHSTLGSWGMLVLLAGCGSKLQVDHQGPAVGVGGNTVTEPGTGGGGNTIAPFGGSGGSSPTQDCVAQTVTEAMGTPAQTAVLVPAHCDTGFTCGSDGKCAALPACPQDSGECVVRGPDQGAGGGSGAGGAGNAAGGAGSVAGAPSTSIMAEAAITCLTADDSNLYWSEYGTRDSLGNYQNNGAVYAQPIGGGTKTALASTLPGPLAIAITDSYIYVQVDGGGLLLSLGHPQLLRFPIAGGTPEVVQDNAVANLVGAGDRAFWTNPYPGPLDPPATTAPATYAQLSTADSMPSQFLDHIVSSMQRDAATLFFLDYQSQNFSSAPLSGGAATSLGLSLLPFALKDDSIYGLEGINNDTGVLLDRADKTGGTWQRVQALGASSGDDLQIVGGRYFWAGNPPAPAPYVQSDYAHVVIRTASFDASSSVVQLLDVNVTPSSNDSLHWVATQSVLYWTDGNGIYARSLSDL